jgi:DNA polymerase-4
MPLRTAYRLCPQAIFLPVDYEEYSRVSEKFKSVLREISPVMEDVGIDEAFLDISDIDRPSEEIAREIKQRVWEEAGLTCSIGIAPNKLLAKIASDMQKPDGLTILTENDIEKRIWPLPVRKLYGVGPKTEAHLNSMGITTIGELAAISLDHLVEQFGRSYGQYLHETSQGIDESPLITHWEPRSTSRETTFEYDISDWQVLAKTLVNLTKEALDDLSLRSYKARTVTVKIRFSDFETHTRAKTMAVPSDSEEDIRKAAFECLKRFELTRKVRLIGVRLSGLEKT